MSRPNVKTGPGRPETALASGRVLQSCPPFLTSEDELFMVAEVITRALGTYRP